jgi:hypothetical protein
MRMMGPARFMLFSLLVQASESSNKDPGSDDDKPLGKPPTKPVVPPSRMRGLPILTVRMGDVLSIAYLQRQMVG